MNPNRQNNCCPFPAGAGVIGRPGKRPPMPCPPNMTGNVPCCSDVAPVRPIVPCCSDVAPVRPIVPCCSDVAPVQPIVPCCSDVAPVRPTVPCCDDGVPGGIILGAGNKDCDKEKALCGLPIAMAYVPWQKYCNIYPLPQALRNGTMFRELDLEFAGRRCN